jgi:hypothetical protein
MKLKVDTQQRFLTVFLFLVEMYKLLMGSCLTLFVPQLCNTATCSLTEIIYLDSTLHRVAMGFNAYSLLMFLVFYCVELRRENWCIQYLDMDDSKSAVHLDAEIEAYPAIKSKMGALNYQYRTAVIVCTVSQIINVAISIADIAQAWAGISSLTPLASYVLIIFIKLGISFQIAQASLQKERALSAFMKAPRTYNTIDEDHRLVLQPVSLVV